MGRIVTVVGIVLSVGTAYLASNFNSIMDYVQALFSIFNAPLLATFLLGMFWRRTTGWGGFWGLFIGTLVSIALWVGETFMHLFSLGSSEGSSMWRALIAFVVCFVITVTVSLFTERKTDGELTGLVYGLTKRVQVTETVWYKRPLVLVGIASAIFIVLNIAFF
jgi:SSS family solute:Na+ symporter